MGENGKHVSAARMECLSVIVGALSIFARLGSCQDPVCPENYTEYPGDVPGWGSIISLPNFFASPDLPPIINIDSCALACDFTTNCCSFEFSQTEMRCNLNTECGPTSTENYNDYTFCGKRSGDGHGIGGSGDGHHMGGSGYGNHMEGSGYGHHMGGSGDGHYMGGFGDGHHMGGSGDGHHMGGSGYGHHMGGSGDGHHSGHHVGGSGSGFGEHPIEVIEGYGSGHHIGGSGEGHHSGSSSGQGELPIELTVEGSGHHVGGSGSGFGEHPIEITEGPSSGHLTGGPEAPTETTTTTTTTPTTTTSTTTTTTEGEMPVEIPVETPEPGCCSEKTVGGIHYVLVGTGETEVYNCLDNCIYHSTIPRDVWQYCFKPGRKAVQCNDATVTPSSGHHHPTEGPVMDHGLHSNMNDHSMIMEDHPTTEGPMMDHGVHSDMDDHSMDGH